MFILKYIFGEKLDLEKFARIHFHSSADVFEIDKNFCVKSKNFFFFFD